MSSKPSLRDRTAPGPETGAVSFFDTSPGPVDPRRERRLSRRPRGYLLLRGPTRVQAVRAKGLEAPAARGMERVPRHGRETPALPGSARDRQRSCSSGVVGRKEDPGQNEPKTHVILHAQHVLTQAFIPVAVRSRGACLPGIGLTKLAYPSLQKKARSLLPCMHC